MNLVKMALSRPITILVICAGLLIFSVIGLSKIPIDIFPKLNLPSIYVIEPYGGMSASQMEGYFSTGMQDYFLYVTGIKNIESKNIQGLTFLKLNFYEGTDMAQATSEVATYVGRTLKFFPAGALPPLVVRFDASSLPVGELVFSSPNRSLDEIYDLAMTRTRPMFATVPGLTATPAMGGTARSVIINVDPAKLRSQNITPDEVVEAIAKGNVMAPSGNIRINNTMYVTTTNALEQTVEQFSQIPIKTSDDRTIFVGDVGRVSDAADVTMDYALVNGKRSIYIPVVKTADASTMDVIKGLKERLPEMQSLLPEDVHVQYEFDQSVFVMNAVKSLMSEGVLGAILTGLMVLLFLGDLRSSLIVIITIPVSISIGILFLSLAGQTINIMTLSGLALAVGVLVDESTVTIENVFQHFEMGKNKRQAIYDACVEIAFPKLLILFCVLAVFVPSFMMKGVPKAMFLPLSLAIGFTMIASYLLSMTMVPVLCNWMLSDKIAEGMRKPGMHAEPGEPSGEEEVKEIISHHGEEVVHTDEKGFFAKIKTKFNHRIRLMMPHKKRNSILYLCLMLLLAGLGFVFIGKDLLPQSDNGQFQIRMDAPEGTRLERTEEKVQKVLAVIDSTVKGHIKISSAFVGPVSTNYATSNLYVFNTGTHEAVIQVEVDEDYKVKSDELKEALRKNIHHLVPDVRITFEPIDLTEKVMSQGATNPIEVRVAGKDMEQIGGFADSLEDRIKQISYLRDVRIQQPLNYPTIEMTLDRYKISQFGLNIDKVSNSITSATSSSRFIEKNMWLDNKTAYTYQVQVQVPEYSMATINELKEVPLTKGQNRPVLGDVAEFKITTQPAEYDRAGPRRYLTIGANINGKDLETATKAVEKAVNSMGQPPKGVKVEIKGMSSLLTETLSSLQSGLMFAVIVILLLLTANYESFPVALTVISTVPAVIFGSIAMLFLTGSTLNLQSYMGMIMSTGVSVANALLIVTNAERIRLETGDAEMASKISASIRLRPILMTSMAMVVGMVPMASGLGDAGAQSAPLGRAVIGGLIASTFASLFILPQLYAWVRANASVESSSLLPEKV